VSRYQKGKTYLDFTEEETVSGSGISWAMQVCTLLQTGSHTSTSPLSFFYTPDALPAAQSTASKHWRQLPPMFKYINK